ncbi:hypothetical protein COOONC_13871 [Cooperia oncophora]
MRRDLSAAYTRALQFSFLLFFLFFCPQALRTLAAILTALRPRYHNHPCSTLLSSSFEINFVDKVLKRRKFITEKSGSHGKESADGDSERVYDEEVDDRILNLDVAKTVVEQALAAVPATEASGWSAYVLQILVFRK